MSDELVHIAFARIQYHSHVILHKGNKIIEENRLKCEKFYNQQVIAGKKRNGTYACIAQMPFLTVDIILDNP